MYIYDKFDQEFVDQRAAEFKDQVKRRLAGELSEAEFRPLRLQNGLYLQLHAYMLRVAIPYGTLSSKQMRMLGDLADKYDRGYGHFTTRQNIQYNWPELKDVPAMLDDLASVQMHAIQTSGNCIRNVTSDPFAGVAADEYFDPRPVSEWLRQWSSLHPEFLHLPRKFKIAVCGAAQDRAAIALHDIGMRLRASKDGKPIYDVYVGGGMGRTPRIAELIRADVPEEDLLPYLEAIMRVYNAYGRRDNKYKARIKILLAETGVEEFKAQVQKEFERIDRGPFEMAVKELRRIETFFKLPEFEKLDDKSEAFETASSANKDFARWVSNNLFTHKAAGYAVVSISVKPEGGIPGDVTGDQMRALADLADEFSLGELRITHRQNVVLPYVKKQGLYKLWQGLVKIGLEEGNIGEITDIICCPGLDYCALATARSIPLAQEISTMMMAREKQDNIGKLSINMSGCINACGHHHVGNIGILGLNKNEEEFYQITLGGASDNSASIGKVAGRGFSQAEVPDAISRLIDVYLENREDEAEDFITAFRRLGNEKFKEALYGNA